MPYARAFGLQKRLILIALLAFLPAFLLALHSYREQRALALRTTEAETAAMLEQIAQTLSRVVSRARAQAETLADVPVVRNGSPAACSGYLARMRERERQGVAYANLSRIDARGQMTCSAVPIDGPLDLSANETVRRGLSSRSYTVSDYELGQVTGHGVVVVTAPILSPTAEIEGIIAISIDLSWLQGHFDAATLPAGTRLTMMDDDGTVLVSLPDGSLAGSRPPAAETLLQAASERTRGVLRLPQDPGHLYEFVLLGQGQPNRLLVYAAIPLATINAAADAQFRNQLLGLLLALALTGVATYAVSRRLVVRPVQRLQAAAQQLAQGDFAARANLGSGNDEILSLGDSFNHMAASLQARDAALRERQTQIERLNRVYAVLSSINGLIIRTGPRQQLLREACQIAVDRGGFGLAWIGLLDRPRGRFETIVAAGGDEATRQELVPAPCTSPADWPELQAVFASGRTGVLPLDEGEARRQRRAAEGYAACAVLPLKPEREVSGCMVLYAHAAEAVDATEMQLLEEMAADISHALAYRSQSDRLSYLTSTDPVTGLPNLTSFHNRLRMALELIRHEPGRREVAVMLTRVDGVRMVNAVHGLHTGDQLLREAAQRLNTVLPDATVLARIRGGVFAIAVPKPPVGDFAGVTRRIVEGFETPLEVEALRFNPGIKIGISLYPSDGSDPSLLIQHAETALSHALDAPEPFRFFIRDLQQQVEQRLATEVALHQALERDELFLLYQPVVSLPERRLTGVEALIRWRHPERGDISPGAFIPVAEDSGLIVPLGTWAMREAFRQARRWADAGLELKIAVNVAASQMKQADFLTTVDEAVRDAGVDPTRVALGIELTESELMDDAPRATELLHELKARGFALSIDDFGTGYSSLAYLERFPLDVLKIDIAFIRPLSDQPASQPIVEAIIALARALRLSTIAEGVETAEQLEQLTRLGCDSVQGYLFGRPMPAEQVEKMAGRELPVSPE